MTIQTIFWDVKDTLLYPQPFKSDDPAKAMGFDMILINWIRVHPHINHVIISNYLEDSVHQLVTQARIKDCFSHISGINDTLKAKPDISQYEAIPTALKSNTHRQLMVGDQLSDMQFAQNVGIQGLLIHRAHHSDPSDGFITIQHSSDVVRWLDAQC